MYTDGAGGLIPPPLHPTRSSAPPSPSSSSTHPRPPPLPPRPGSSSDVSVNVPRDINVNVDVDVENASGSDSDSELGEDADADSIYTATPAMGVSTDSLASISTKAEEGLSEVQLREAYDDEEIDRFLHLFSTYVREVRVANPGPTSASAPALAQSTPIPIPGTSSSARPDGGSASSAQTGGWDASRPISEVLAQDFLVPLLPAPRPPMPDFTLSRMKQTAQRLYVAAEPLYSMVGVPLLKLATWQDPRRSFAYCALYWILWYHGLLISALVFSLLYHIVRWKVHPYPSLADLRDHRTRIERSQTFGTILSTRLAASPALGMRDMWDLFGDYRHIRKLKRKAKQDSSVGKNEAGSQSRVSLDDGANVRSVSFSTTDLTGEHDRAAKDAQEEADLKRLGLFLLNEVADLLERLKNIFLWRQPSATAYYGVILLGWLVLGLLPARYLVRTVGFSAGFVFWHVIPVVAAIPASELNRIPPPLWMVPTDTEYAMELISQRVARGLPVRPKRRRARRRGSGGSVLQAEEARGGGGESSSIDWNKWGGRIADTKERAGELKQIFRDGQWKQAENWKALNPLAPKVAAPQSGSEARIETQTFPAQLKKNPGLITLTPSTLFFTPLLSSHPILTVPLADITGVKKTSLTKGIDVHYTLPRDDGGTEAKEANFMLVGSRSDLFARLVSWGGKRWTNV